MVYYSRSATSLARLAACSRMNSTRSSSMPARPPAVLVQYEHHGKLMTSSATSGVP